MCSRILILSLILSITSPEAPADMRESSQENIKRAGRWAYQDPPKAHYTIECSIEPNKGLLEGTENIRLKNTTKALLRELQIKRNSHSDMEVRCRGETIRILLETKEKSGTCVTVVELPEPIHPGGDAELQIEFRMSSSEYAGVEKLPITNWYPRLWWGIETHDEYDVKVETIPGYAMVTSGAPDSKSGYYHADNVRTFGLFLGKNHKIAKVMTKNVLVQVIFTPKGKECTQLLLKTAVDVINFYCERFGFYPHSVLSIIPGMNRPAGGYPVATGIVAVHGMEQFDSKPKLHWQWITAHEIGHEY
jgi:hypothetical protein